MNDELNDDFQNKLRYHINRYIFDNGFAPSADELSEITGTNINEIQQGLIALADNHALVLHPNSFDIWIAHPFALYPTLFWVKTKDKEWWGNCTWCSLGIASMAKTDTDINTKAGGEEETLTIRVHHGKIVEKNLFVHFPISAKRFWDNVVYTCSNMLTFKSEKDIDEWCSKHRIEKGEVVPLEQVWELAKLWYGNYLDPDWKRKTPEAAEEIFKKAGLTSDFWKMKT